MITPIAARTCATKYNCEPSFRTFSLVHLLVHFSFIVLGPRLWTKPYSLNKSTIIHTFLNTTWLYRRHLLARTGLSHDALGLTQCPDRGLPSLLERSLSYASKCGRSACRPLASMSVNHFSTQFSISARNAPHENIQRPPFPNIHFLNASYYLLWHTRSFIHSFTPARYGEIATPEISTEIAAGKQ